MTGRRWIVDCEKAKELMSSYLDSELLAELRESIAQHLTGCRDCKVEFDTVRMTMTLYHADRHVVTPIAVSARLQEALARAYRELGERETEA
jgi:predicted anti-sigma-YlaC factor YlaD